MTYDGHRIDELDRRLEVTSDWIDDSPANAARDEEARTWGRLAKVTEEHGEVVEAWLDANAVACGRMVSAFIGATGQNPRKGVSDTMEHVAEELMDVALTAMAAWVHVRPGESVLRAFEAHLESRMKRVGLL